MGVVYLSHNFKPSTIPYQNYDIHQQAIEEYTKTRKTNGRNSRNRGNETEGLFQRAISGDWIQAQNSKGELLFDKNDNPIYRGFQSHPDEYWDYEGIYEGQFIKINHKSTHRSRVKESAIKKIENNEGIFALNSEWLPGTFLDFDNDEAANNLRKWWTNPAKSKGSIEQEFYISKYEIKENGQAYQVMRPELYQNMVKRLDKTSFMRLIDDLDLNLTKAPDFVVSYYTELAINARK